MPGSGCHMELLRAHRTQSALRGTSRVTGKWLRLRDNPKIKSNVSSVTSRTAVLKWRWRSWVKKLACSLCFFLPTSLQEWSLFGSHMKKETFVLDQFRPQAAYNQSSKENQQQRKKQKHPRQVVTWGALSAWRGAALHPCTCSVLP